MKQVESSLGVLRTTGQSIVDLLKRGLETLDDNEQKRSLLAGALLLLKDGRYLSVPHGHHMHQGKLRTHPGAGTGNCTLMSSEELGSQVEAAWLGLLAPPLGVPSQGVQYPWRAVNGDSLSVRLAADAPLKNLVADFEDGRTPVVWPLREALSLLEGAGAIRSPWSTGLSFQTVNDRSALLARAIGEYTVAWASSNSEAGSLVQMCRHLGIGDGEGVSLSLKEAAMLLNGVTGADNGDHTLALGLLSGIRGEEQASLAGRAACVVVDMVGKPIGGEDDQESAGLRGQVLSSVTELAPGNSISVSRWADLVDTMVDLAAAEASPAFPPSDVVSCVLDCAATMAASHTEAPARLGAAIRLVLMRMAAGQALGSISTATGSASGLRFHGTPAIRQLASPWRLT